jgi:hypothetical protein
MRLRLMADLPFVLFSDSQQQDDRPCRLAITLYRYGFNLAAIDGVSQSF